MLAVGLWHPRKALEITDRDRQTRWAAQAEIEERDIPEMVEGQNAYRRQRGETEITEADAQRAAAATQRESIDRAKQAGGER